MMQFFLNGLSRGSVDALVALGFGLIFFAAGTFHIAHGAIYTAAAFTCYAFSGYFDYSLWIGIPAGLLVAIVIGTAIEYIIYRPLLDPRKSHQGSSPVIMISSLGTYVIIVNMIALIAGNEQRTILNGIQPTLVFGNLVLTLVQLAQIVTCIIVISGALFFLWKTSFGRTIRALANDTELISILGYDIWRLRLLVFAIGSLLAGLGGILSALDVGTYPDVGFSAFLIAAVACMIGGYGYLLMPVVGALLLGIVQSIVVWKWDAKWSSAAVYGLLVLFLVMCPGGLVQLFDRIRISLGSSPTLQKRGEES